MKVCTGCKAEKPFTDFGRLATVKSGRRSRCKRCEADAQMNRYRADPEAARAKMRESYRANPEKHRKRALKWHYENHERAKARGQKWKAANPDRVAEYNAQHYADHRDHHRARYRAWASENRDRLREYMRGWYSENPGKHSEYARNRLRDPRVRIENSVRCRIWSGITRGSKGGRRTMSLVGYTIEELKVHLERQFQRGMTWENYGEWHIDHIVPLSSFSYTTPDDPDFRRAWALTNLRPMWGVENLAKGAKRLTLL